MITATHAGLHSAEEALNWCDAPENHCSSSDKSTGQTCNGATEIGHSYSMSVRKPLFLTVICIKYLGSLLEMQEHKAEWERSRVLHCTRNPVVKLVELKN